MEKAHLLQQMREKEEKDKRRFNELIDMANRWQQAKVLREFLRAFKETANKGQSISEKLIQWFDWAENRINGLDPLKVSQLKEIRLYSNY